MEQVTVKSTSSRSAKVDDFVLRCTSTTRLVFRPLLVDNPSNRVACVEGSFVFQRKSPKHAWEDAASRPLSSLHKDEGYQLNLNSAETLLFFQALGGFYQIYRQGGIPSGTTTYEKAAGPLVEIAKLATADLEALLGANEQLGLDLIKHLLAWAANDRACESLATMLDSFQPEALANLNVAVNLSAMNEVQKIWNENRENPGEEFWQRLLASRPYLLEQLFSWPCSIIADKAYVGGKSIQNTGGNVVDFLLKNQLTVSVALIEIKTPVAPLTGRPYRGNVPNVSSELAGSVLQILTYKNSLVESHQSLRNGDDIYDVFDPSCIVIIGNTESLSHRDQRRSFELFRRQLLGVEVVTFDELFGRVAKLAEVLQLGAEAPATPIVETWEPPF